MALALIVIGVSAWYPDKNLQGKYKEADTRTKEKDAKQRKKDKIKKEVVKKAQQK